jgi:archaeal flagellin FlaB
LDGLSFWAPRTLINWEVKRVKITLTLRMLLSEKHAAIGIGSLIIFIAMILVAGIAASVFIQTMNSLEQQALQSGQEAIKDVSNGLRVTQVSGYNNGSTITQIAIFLRTTAGSDYIDLTYTYISLSDSSQNVILDLNSSVFSNTVSGGLFGTLNDTNITSTTYGLMVIRDVDNSCNTTSPIINNDDLVVLLINTTACFSGIDVRTEVTGNVVPEYGISGVISFTTPSSYINNIIELQK